MSTTFSILTPCYNALQWLPACVASVADQTGVSFEHLVQDGGSKDGTAEYVLSEKRVLGSSEPDQGMYDAINKAWAKCTGEYVVHLNADEELLPGALEAVAAYFKAHPKVDVVLAASVIVNATGGLMCYRKPIRPTMGIMATSHHPIPSCAVFLRRASFTDRPWLYDPEFRHISDVLLMIDIVKAGKNIGVLNTYTSVFVVTGTNIGLTQAPRAQKEYAHQMSLATRWQKLIRPLILANFYLHRLLTGHYSQRNLSYDIYLPDHLEQRRHFEVAKPSGIYRPGQTQDVHLIEA